MQTVLIGSLIAGAAAQLASQAVSADPWDAVTELVEKFPLDDYCVSAGRGTRQYMHCKGNMTMDRPLFLASSSKFPTASAIMNVVSDPTNKLELESLASDFLDYWTTDQADLRSRVTLKSLLSFTSGFYDSGPGGGTPCMDFNSTVPFDDCIKEIYEIAPFAFEPGSTWDYNSYHLQVAGGMATAASGQSMIEILTDRLLKPVNMTQSQYLNPLNPSLAAGLMASGNDYEKFLISYLEYQVITKELAAAAEKDVIQPGVAASNSSQYLLTILGHYGFAHYFQCLPPKASAFTEKCLEDAIHADPGLFGYWPLIDRKNNLYLQIVQEKIVDSGYNLGPTIKASVLLDLLQPLVNDIIVNGTVGSTTTLL